MMRVLLALVAVLSFAVIADACPPQQAVSQCYVQPQAFVQQQVVQSYAVQAYAQPVFVQRQVAVQAYAQPVIVQQQRQKIIGGGRSVQRSRMVVRTR